MSQLEGLVVRRMRAAYQVADGLCERTVGDAFAPGDRLRESAIATELGIAGNTVREAVRILELSGLVGYEVNRGAVTVSAAPEQLDGLYARRERLETAAVARIPTPSQVASVVKADNELVQAAGSHDARQIVDSDLAFHLTKVAMMESTRLDAFCAELNQAPRFYLTVASVEYPGFEDPREILAEHEAILDAIRFGDPGPAVPQARFHIDTNARRLREILLERN